MNGSMGTPGSSSNTALLLQALFRVTLVRAELQALLPQAQASGSAGVTGEQVQRWLASLQSALDALGGIATILIFPPPASSVLIGEAQTQIRAAADILRSLPFTPIAPASLSRGAISLQSLQAAINALLQAEMALLRAIRAP
jgi:hypothetical protein